MDIDFDYYRVFYYAAKFGSITRAGMELMRSQPNVTRTIHLLESQLGCKLFLRSGRGVQLTAEGEKLYSHVRVAMDQLETGIAELAIEQSLQGGVITIGASEVALRCFLLPLLNDFHTQYPNVKLRILNDTAVEAVTNLKNGTVDFAVARVPEEAAMGLQREVLCEIPEVAVCSDGFPELMEGTVSLEQLAGYPIISLGSQTLMYHAYHDWFQAHGLRFSPDVEVATSGQILPLVENALGIGFVPESFFRQENCHGIHKIQLAEAIPACPLCFLKRQKFLLSSAAQRLEEMILLRR